MTSPILYAGQEDISFIPIGAGITSTVVDSGGNWGVDTTSTHFRTGYGRYGLGWLQHNFPRQAWLRSNPAFSSSNFWTTARLFSGGANGADSNQVMQWIDSAGVVRLRVTNNNVIYPGIIKLEKVNAAGSVTTLATSLIAFGVSISVAKIDVFINYAASGTFAVYTNGNLIVSFSGDVTTDSQTVLSNVDFGVASGGGGQSVFTTWSECIVSTSDTRNMGLVTQAATALGNTDTFTSGAVSNINPNFGIYTSPDNSSTATQIQEYKVTPAMPTGAFSVVSVVQHGMCTIGPSGPQHVQFMVRTGGADFNSSSLAPGVSWGLLTYNWDTNPNTAVAWLTTDLAASSTAFNFGYESIA